MTARRRTPPRAVGRPGVIGGRVPPVSSQGSEHGFFGLPLTAEGWTDLDAMILGAGYSDARIVYVSSSVGNDGTGQTYSQSGVNALSGTPTNPSSAPAPFATVSAAYAQMRSGYPDVMLLKRGDTFSEEVSMFISGRSASERLIFAAYGDESVARPIVTQVRSTADTTQYIVFADMHVVSASFGQMLGGTILYEGIHFENTYTYGRTIEIGIRQSAVRRSGFTNISLYSGWGVPGEPFPQYGFHNSLLEENAYYSDPGLEGEGGGFWHNVYINDRVDSPITRHCVSGYSPGVGYRQRAGGTIEGMVVLYNPILDAIEIGVGGSNDSTTSDYALLKNSLVIANDQGVGLANFDNITYEGNLLIRSDFTFDNSGAEYGGNFANVSITGNVVYGVLGLTSNTTVGNGSITNNDFQRQDSGALLNMASGSPFTFSGNQFYSTAATSSWFVGESYGTYVPSGGSNTEVSYPDPTRDAQSYMELLGTSPSSEAEATQWFMDGVPGDSTKAGAVHNRKGAWDERFLAITINNHVRAGFGLTALVADYSSYDYSAYRP